MADPAVQLGTITYQTTSKPADTNDFDGDGNRTELFGQSPAASATVASTAALESLKYVRGELDSAWSRYPVNGQSVPGGSADYRLTSPTSATSSLKTSKSSDILPFVGDTGVIGTTELRQSAWRPTLAGPVPAPSGILVYYSTSPIPSAPKS